MVAGLNLHTHRPPLIFIRGMDMIEKTISGFTYKDPDGVWQVQTDFDNEKIYLSPPHDDSDINAIRDFGVAIGRAVKDMKQDAKHRKVI
jgi:hypothetical protein